MSIAESPKGKNNIAFVLPSLAHGGAQKVFLDLYTYLKKNNEGIFLIVLDREGELLSRVGPKDHIVFLDEKLSGLGFLKRMIQFIRLRKFIKQKNVTTLYSTITGMNVFAILVTRWLSGTKVIIREASSLENIRSGLLMFLAKKLYRYANRVICTSSYVKQQLCSDFHLNTDTTIELPNPVDQEGIRHLSQEPVGNLVGNIEEFAVAVGRLIPAKGFDVLIRSLALVNKATSLDLIIVGDGPELEKLTHLAQEEGISDKVHFAGYQENPYSFIKAAKVFVLSSRWEGYVNVLIEAMALSKPIVATDCNSGPGDLLKKYKGADLVPIEDCEVLSESILKCLEGPKSIDYSQIIDMHSIKSVANQYLKEARE